MAHIAPFQAWRYAPERVSVSQVVTQPYDKITPEMQERYYEASPANLVRIILGKRQPTDGPGENVYTRAAASFSDWRRSGILSRDPQPSLYRYSQTFAVPGNSKTLAERQGYIALGRLEDYSAGVVFRHELTHSGPKADRLELLRATRTHFEQIFLLYADSGGIEGRLQSSAPPDIEVTDEYGVLHRVWRVSDPVAIAAVQEQMRDQKLIIADGHHRYETALAYRNERRTAASAGEAPYDWMMMTFFNMDSPGLVILPTHRVVYGLSSFSAAKLQAGARQFFNVEEVDASLDATRATAILHEAGHAGTALLVATADRAFLMHTPKTLGTNHFAGLSLRQQSLDVVQLHKCLLEGVLNISEDAIRNLQNVSYHRDAADALAQVRSGQAQAAFLMNPVRMRQVRDIAFAGEVLPQKSTDFYPKLLSGLTIYAME
jgi:uncharacterized protein (DUF1015 family)